MNVVSEVFSRRSLSDATAQSADQLSLPGWETSERIAPLDIRTVQAIYDRINWSFVVDILDRHARQYGAYGEAVPISMCKALVLPYLASIPSLAELARRLEEYDAYRVVCGFHGRPPTRAMLWHFQYAPLPGEKRRKQRGETDKERKTWFYEILYHALTRAVIVSKALELELPFRYVGSTPGSVEAGHELSSTALDLQEYPRFEVHLVHRQNEHFPAQVHVCELEKPVDLYTIQPPPWWGDEEAKPNHHYEISSLRSVRQSTACSAVILSNENTILLGKRRSGYKPGYYALPGGRWRPEETLRECVVREIKEETGLDGIDVRPISISFNRYQDGHAECWSVGALITEFEGQVTLREPDRCEGWNWYRLDALPQPLFRPSQIIIDDYKLDRFPDITWDRIEDWIEKTQEDEVKPTPVSQLRLPL